MFLCEFRFKMYFCKSQNESDESVRWSRSGRRRRRIWSSGRLRIPELPPLSQGLQSEGPALVRGTSPPSQRSDHLHRPGSHQQSHCPHKGSTDRGTSRRSDHIAASPNLGPKCTSESFLLCFSGKKKTKKTDARQQQDLKDSNTNLVKMTAWI